MQNKTIEELVDGFNWTFAKSMPNNPHYYIVKQEVDPRDYERLYWFIYDHPTIVKWWRKDYKAARIGKHLYWIMTDDVNESRIINRKELLTE